MRRARGEDRRPSTPAYRELAAAIEQAQAEAQVFAMAALHKAMSWNWRAAAWYLANVDPYWRQYRLRPEAEPTQTEEAEEARPPPARMVFFSLEDLERVGLKDHVEEARRRIGTGE